MPSIYDKREHEIMLERRMAQERRRAILEGVLLAPVILACVVAWVAFCACM